MGRPERAVDPAEGPVAQFALALRELRASAGRPSYRRMSRLINCSVTSLSEAAGGNRLPSLSTTLAYVEACGGDPSVWAARWRAVAGEPTVSEPDPEESARCPYLGLTAFQQEDATRFFGRDRIVGELLSLVGEHRFVAVVGASGCGKSSVLRAGLAARAGASGQPAIVITPGEHPGHSLRHLLAAESGTERLLIVDQFEEIFTLCAEAERIIFIAALTAAAATGQVRVVLGLRADFYGDCSRYPQLVRALNTAQLLIGPMTTTELTDAIRHPARVAGLIVETALVAQLVSEAAGQPGALPLVSHALVETWRRRQGSRLTAAGYQAAGGIQHAIAQTAERAYHGLDPAQQDLARQILLRLCAYRGVGEPVRRQASRDELPDDPCAAQVLDVLAGARLLTIAHDTVELAHEAVMRCWPRLRDWLEDGREGVRTRQQLTEAAATWEAFDRDPGSLYRGAQLTRARDWAAAARHLLTANEERFLLASLAAEAAQHATARRHARRRRQLVGLVTVVALAAGVVTAEALRFRATAAREHEIVAAQRVLTELDPLYEQGRRLLAFQLVLASYRLNPSPDARTALLQFGTGVAPGPTGSYVSSVAFGGDVLASIGRTVDLWYLTGPPDVLTSPAHTFTGITAVAISADGQLLAARQTDNRLSLWYIGDLRHPKQLWLQPPPLGSSDPEATITALKFSPDGHILAAAGNASLKLMDVTDPTQPYVLSRRAPTGAVTVLEFTPDGRGLVTAGDTIEMWMVTDSTNPLRLTHLDDGEHLDATAVAVNPEGRLAVTATSRGAVTLWDITNPRKPVHLWSPEATGAVYAATFGLDGKLLIAGRRTVLLDVANPRAPSELATLPNTPTTVHSAVFEPEAGIVVTANMEMASDSDGPVKAGYRTNMGRYDVNVGRVAARVCGTIDTPITQGEWDQYFPGLAYDPPCAHPAF
jgi:WD40 repeat protein